MRILYYCWNENSAEDIQQTFTRLGELFVKVSYAFKNFDSDEEFECQVKQLIEQQKLDCIFTFNYFPILSNIANVCGIKYISWVYDCPHLMLYSKTITNECNYIFVFDRVMEQIVASLGALHVYHLPLAVNTGHINSLLNLPEYLDDGNYDSDISFVGSLYENNMYSQIKFLPDYIKGYFDGIISSQKEIWGYNFVEELLSDNIVEEAMKYIKFDENPNYSFGHKNIISDMINNRITSDERIKLLGSIADKYSLDLYSASDSSIIKNCNFKGTISYHDEMPRVFNRSKININISLRSITSGIPLRCLDIMGAGGFLMSNYQPELAEFFVPGEDFVYFESEQDLIDKIQYYLEHENERKQIAYNGWQKIQQFFSYETQFSLIRDTVNK